MVSIPLLALAILPKGREVRTWPSAGVIEYVCGRTA